MIQYREIYWGVMETVTRALNGIICDTNRRMSEILIRDMARLLN